jgi:hypothetical protein
LPERTQVLDSHYPPFTIPTTKPPISPKSQPLSSSDLGLHIPGFHEEIEQYCSALTKSAKMPGYLHIKKPYSGELPQFGPAHF